MRTHRKGISSASAVFAAVIILVVALSAYYVLGVAHPSNSSGPTTSGGSPLISFSADAYTAETTALLSGFSQSSGIPVAPVKSGGSFADANQIVAGAPDDVFVSVALSATGTGYLKNYSAGWAIGFASDQMVIAYSNATAVAGVASLGNAAASSNSTSDWNSFFSALTSGGVRVGIADPVADPAGLRGWLVLEVAGYLYAGGNVDEYSGALVQNAANVTGTHAAALVAPLQSGQIQFLFIYKSAAVADHLAYVQLDRHVNLGDPALAAYYSNFSFTDTAGRSSGSPIILCMTVPLSSTNTDGALRFVQYVVKNAGSLSTYGLQPFSPVRLYSNATPPPAVSALVADGLATEVGSLP